MKTSRRLLRNFAILFLGNVVGQVLALGALVYLARVFSPALFGVWNLAQAWMLYLFRAGEMGLEVIGIRTIASSRVDISRQVAGNVVVTRLIIAAILLLVMGCAVFAGAFPEGSGGLILVFSLSVVPLAIILEWLFEAHQSTPVVALARILKGALLAALILLFVRSEQQITTAAYLYGVSLALPALAVAVVAHRRYGLLPVHFRWSEARAMLRASFPVGAATILSQYSLLAGTVLAGYMATKEDLGFYSAGQRLIMFLWAYGIVTSNRVILPQLSRLHEESAEEFAHFVKKYIRLLTLVALPLAIVGVAGGSDVIRMLYGDRYAASIPVFQVLSVALAVAITRSVLEIGLIASRRQTSFMIGMIGQAVLVTLFSLAGLMTAGIVGLAWAAVAAEVCYALYLVAVFRAVKPAELARMLWKPLTGAAIVLGLLSATGATNLVVVLGGGCALYVGFLVATGEVSKKDFVLLLETIGVRTTVS